VGQTLLPQSPEPVQGQRYPQSRPILSTTSTIEEVLNLLPSPLKAFVMLHLDMSLVAMHRHTQVGGRLHLFVRNWERLTRDSWTLSTVRGYQLPLCRWPTAGATLTSCTWDHIQEGRNLQLGTKRSCCTSSGPARDSNGQPTLRCTQKRRRMAPDNRSSGIEPVLDTTPFQDGGLTYATLSASDKHAHGKNQFKRCLPHHPSGQQVSSSPGISKHKGKLLSVHSTAFRALHRSVRFYKANKASGAVPPQPRHQHSHLSRRHAHISNVTRQPTLPSSNSPLATCIPGVHYKCSKVSARPSHTKRISGVLKQYHHNVDRPTNRQSSRDSEGDSSPVATVFSSNKGPCTARGEAGSNKASDFHCSSALSCLAECANYSNVCAPGVVSSLTRSHGRPGNAASISIVPPR